MSKHENEDVDQNPPGVFIYKLSNREFIEKGWTMLPVEKVVKKVHVYRMEPANPESDWFTRNKNKGTMKYESGEKLAEFDESGRGRLFYRNGRLALNYYDSEEVNIQQRFVIYSSGERDERGRTHPVTVLALFDYLGNGVVFDHSGKVRIKYNQMEGVILDKGVGPYSHWKWHTLNDPPILKVIMVDTTLEHKDEAILKLGKSEDDNPKKTVDEDMIAIEFDNFVQDRNKHQEATFTPFQIKMKALKINENFSLRILDQTKIYLTYQDGSTKIKLNIGMKLIPNEILDEDLEEIGQVITPVDKYPAQTESLADIQRSIEHAKSFEHSRHARESRLKPAPSANDTTTALLSQPLQPQPRSIPSRSNLSITQGSSRRRCPSLYYNTRLI